MDNKNVCDNITEGGSGEKNGNAGGHWSNSLCSGD